MGSHGPWITEPSDNVRDLWQCTQITPTHRQLSTNHENPVKRPCDNWQCRCTLEVSITAAGGELEPLHGSRLPKLRKSTDNVKKLKAGPCIASSTGYSKRQLHRGKQARSHDSLAGPRGTVKSEEPLAGRNETFEIRPSYRRVPTASCRGNF